MISKGIKAIATKSGRIKGIRGAAISKEISETHGVKFDEQMAVAINALEAIFAYIEAKTGENIRPADFIKYEALREEAKNTVDKEIDAV
jgi:hypothetical protein